MSEADKMRKLMESLTEDNDPVQNLSIAINNIRDYAAELLRLAQEMEIPSEDIAMDIEYLAGKLKKMANNAESYAVMIQKEYEKGYHK